jgi:hypothetical protein
LRIRVFSIKLLRKAKFITIMHKHANNTGRNSRWHVEIRRPFPEVIKVFDFVSMREMKNDS